MSSLTVECFLLHLAAKVRVLLQAFPIAGAREATANSLSLCVYMLARSYKYFCFVW